MLLSKEVNAHLWKQLGKLYNILGPERAAFATPVMVEGGEVKWYSYLDGSRGEEGEFVLFSLLCEFCVVSSYVVGGGRGEGEGMRARVGV
jgi:hypothetical protein